MIINLQIRSFFLVGLNAQYDNNIKTKKNTMEEFKTSILGNLSTWSFLAICFFGLIGIIIHQLMDLGVRDKKSDATPKKFSLMFFIEDNYKKWVLSILLFYIFIRFSPQLLGIELNEFAGLLVGLFSTELSKWLKTRLGVLKIDREKYIKKK